MLTLRPADAAADAGGSFKHVLRVGWLVFWQETERGNCRFSFFSPKSDLLGLTVVGVGLSHTIHSYGRVAETAEMGMLNRKSGGAPAGVEFFSNDEASLLNTLLRGSSGGINRSDEWDEGVGVGKAPEGGGGGGDGEGVDGGGGDSMVRDPRRRSLGHDAAIPLRRALGPIPRACRCVHSLFGPPTTTTEMKSKDWFSVGLESSNGLW